MAVDIYILFSLSIQDSSNIVRIGQFIKTSEF